MNNELAVIAIISNVFNLPFAWGGRGRAERNQENINQNR
jgi:hypothetical protein